MFRARNMVVALLVITVISLGLIGCAPPVEEVAPPAELKPCSVELSGIYIHTGAGLPLFGSGSTDMVVKIAEFTISNPNDYMVSVDGFGYTIDVGEGLKVLGQTDSTYYIPAGEKLTLEGVVCFQWVALYFVEKEAGLTGAEAIMATLPLWKGLGGAPLGLLYYGYPMTVPPEVWKAVEATKVVYNWEARLHTSGEGMDKYSSYSGSL